MAPLLQKANEVKEKMYSNEEKEGHGNGNHDKG